MADKIIFLDIDGPMIPLRAYFLPNQTKPIVSVFDPCAVSLLNKLIDDSKAKLVISSTWATQGMDRIREVLSDNGIDPTLLHNDWVTPRKLSSWRMNEISWWLRDHPEVVDYVAIEDEDLDVEFVPKAVKCDPYEGFSWRNFLEARVHLNAFGDGRLEDREKTLKTIEWLKWGEINRLKRRGESDEWITRHMVDLFRNPPKADDDED